MAFPSFFGNLFSELIPGGDCSSIEQDPNADPFDKEVCQQFRRFNEGFGRSLDIEHRSPEEENRGKGGSNDPQSLRDAILSRPDSNREEMPSPSRWHGFGRRRHPREDEDLDERVRRDPRLLDKYLDSGDVEPRPRKDSSSPRYHSSYSSVIITARPDGTVEEHRTVIDSDGNEKVCLSVQRFS
ncbi:hypothetical protein GBAR_LOCUS2861 [Geodia barretti]|uniref:Uncharacterized protein n=1 Tax=Geodia barretti TaxID=519541 RepID=A0AA35R210_GEOBA|nr:hypothetical protein GBAR_LOCUS2861 [Geodia barretti]